MTWKRSAITLYAGAIPAGWRAIVISFTVLHGAAGRGFERTAYALLLIIVSIFYCLMCFGLPLIIYCMRDKSD